MAGAIFRQVGVSLFVAGAPFRDILGDNRSEPKHYNFSYKMRLEDGVRDDDFMVGLSSDILGLSSNRLSIGGSTSGSWLYLLRALEMTFHM